MTREQLLTVIFDCETVMARAYRRFLRPAPADFLAEWDAAYRGVRSALSAECELRSEKAARNR